MVEWFHVNGTYKQKRIDRRGATGDGCAFILRKEKEMRAEKVQNEYVLSQDEAKELIKKIRDIYPTLVKAFSLEEMEWCCNATESELTKGYKKMTNETGSCWFKNNGSQILSVAHMDSVCEPTHFTTAQLKAETLVFSPVLDDRAGVYIITRLLPKVGINLDILLTTDEEICKTTADAFKPKKQYNWGVEFDRKGSGVVLYQYDDNESWKREIRKAGFLTELGSYSDISALGHLGCSFMNIGTGIENGHSTRAFISLETMLRNVAKFIIFYRTNAKKKFKHVGLLERMRVMSMIDSYLEQLDEGYDYDYGWMDGK